MDLRNYLYKTERGGDRRFEVDAQQVAGGLSGETLPIEFQAGHQQHVVFAPGPAPFLLQHVEVFIELVASDGEIKQLAEFTNETARVGHMVRDADAVETAPAIEVNHFRERQPAIGVVSVDVEVAKLHA